MTIQEMLADIEMDEKEIDRLCTLPYEHWADLDAAVIRKIEVVEALIEELDR